MITLTYILGISSCVSSPSAHAPETVREVPPAVARAFVEDMLAFHSEPNALKRDEIASRQLHALREHHRGKLRIHDVKEMFEAMKELPRGDALSHK